LRFDFEVHHEDLQTPTTTYETTII
jgi:hypothetical protein